MLKSIRTITTILIFLYSIMLSSQDTLTLFVTDQSVVDNQTITIPFQVNHFDTVAYLQFSIAWDSSVLEFFGLKNFNLEGLAQTSFNLTDESKASGKIGVIWLHPMAQEVSLSDSTIIFELDLNIIADESTTTEINFINDPTNIEAGDVNSVELPVKSQGATIQISKSTTSLAQEYGARTSKLYQNVPNPFTTSTSIAIEMAEGDEVLFEVYDSSGSQIISERQYFPKGMNYKELNKLQLNGAGLYEYRLTIKQKTITKKLVLLAQ